MKKILIILSIAMLVLPVMAGRPKIGLALGGGGAKGAAEVGVLKVLEEAGIHVDYIAGSSIGSIVGGLYAAGYSASELETMFRTQEWLSLLTDRKASLNNEPFKTIDGVTYVFGFPVIDRNSRGFGVMSGGRIEQVIDSMVSVKGCTDFESLKIPFRCVTTDIRTANEVILSKGVLCKALRASMAIPGIFKPVEYNGRLLVDGGMLNNLPVDVDLQQSEQQPRKKSDINAISGIADLFGLGGILEWITNRPDISKYYENRKRADIYIHPDLPDADASSFGNKNAARMILAGTAAARKLLPELRTLISNTSQGVMAPM